MTKPNKRIIYITSSRLAGLMNNERWKLVQAFKKSGHKIVDVEKDNVFNFDLRHLIAHQKESFDLIIFEEMSWAMKLNFRIKFDHCREVQTPKATFISDYWIYTEEFRNTLKHNNITNLFTCHEGSYLFIGKHFSDLVDHLFWAPLTIDLGEFDFPPQEKRYDFFLSGALTYLTPFRGRLINLVKQHLRKYRVYHLDHPGHWRNRENVGIRGESYYKLLAQSYFSLCTSGIYNISSRKYWEISAAKSTIFGNDTGHPETLLIKNNIVNLSQSMNDGQIISKLKDAYENRKYWQQQAGLASKIVREYLSNEKTVKRIEEEIDRLTLPVAKPEDMITKYKNKIHKHIYYNLLRNLPDKV